MLQLRYAILQHFLTDSTIFFFGFFHSVAFLTLGRNMSYIVRHLHIHLTNFIISVRTLDMQTETFSSIIYNSTLYKSWVTV